MEIALEFINKEIKENIKAELVERGFKMEENTFGTIWVYGLDNVVFENGIIDICRAKSIKYYNIKLEDLKYVEIREDK